MPTVTLASPSHPGVAAPILQTSKLRPERGSHFPRVIPACQGPARIQTSASNVPGHCSFHLPHCPSTQAFLSQQEKNIPCLLSSFEVITIASIHTSSLMFTVCRALVEALLGILTHLNALHDRSRFKERMAAGGGEGTCRESPS